MRRLFLDFRRAAPISPAGYLVLALGIVVAGVVAAAHLELNRQVERYSELAVRANAGEPEKAREPVPFQGKSEKEALDNARLVVEHLTVPWDKLFAALEGVQEGDVAVLAITPNVQKRQVRVHAEAKSLASMLSYQRKLEETRLFTDVVLNEHEVQVQDPEKPVRFNVTLTWPL
jgi:alkanesulfonate monooxygenase SsuD/methylene tetrahydromethanopterin reductase-like flavin-dependent oxidoreductase (luciferase family)